MAEETTSSDGVDSLKLLELRVAALKRVVGAIERDTTALEARVAALQEKIAKEIKKDI